MTDIYREAKQLLKENKVNKASLHYAVNVSRWMQVVPELVVTPFGAAKLIWQYQGNYLEMTFLNSKVQVLLCADGGFDNLYEAEQHFRDRIMIDMLYAELVKFTTVSGLPIPSLTAWDEFDGKSLEDINMTIVEEREGAAHKAMIEAYHSFQNKEVKEDVEEQGGIVIEESPRSFDYDVEEEERQIFQ